MIWVDCKHPRQAGYVNESAFWRVGKVYPIVDDIPAVTVCHRPKAPFGPAKPPIHTKMKGENHWLFCPRRVDQSSDHARF